MSFIYVPILYFLKENKIYQQRMQQIIEGLEEKIDPFDLDVFSPYIQSHLMKQAQRSSVSIIIYYVLHIRGQRGVRYVVIASPMK